MTIETDPRFFYNRYEEVRQYECHLPHMQQNDVVQFVTVRLADSLPKERLQEIEELGSLTLGVIKK